MGVFHIEDDWYLVPDQYSWNLARKSKKPSPKSMWAEMTYHRTQAEALIYYMEQKQRETAGNAKDGELSDLIDIFIERTEPACSRAQNSLQKGL